MPICDENEINQTKFSSQVDEKYEDPALERSEKAILWGITSFGSAECDKNGVYTKVSAYMDWMYSVLKQ